MFSFCSGIFRERYILWKISNVEWGGGVDKLTRIRHRQQFILFLYSILILFDFYRQSGSQKTRDRRDQFLGTRTRGGDWACSWTRLIMTDRWASYIFINVGNINHEFSPALVSLMHIHKFWVRLMDTCKLGKTCIFISFGKLMKIDKIHKVW